MIQRAFDELVEVAWLVDDFKLFVEQIIVLGFAHRLQLPFEQHAVRVLFGGHRFGEEVDQGPGLPNTFGRAVESPCAVEHHVADHAAHVPTWKSVVAHIGHARRRQTTAANRENLVLDVGGNPGVDAMRDNVVELAQIASDVAEVGVFELDIGQFKRIDSLVGHFHLPAGTVDADEPAAGELLCNAQQIATTGEAELEDAATVDGRRLHAEECGHGGQPFRVRLPEREAHVGNQVVRVLGFHRRKFDSDVRLKCSTRMLAAIAAADEATSARCGRGSAAARLRTVRPGNVASQVCQVTRRLQPCSESSRAFGPPGHLLYGTFERTQPSNLRHFSNAWNSSFKRSSHAGQVGEAWNEADVHGWLARMNAESGGLRAWLQIGHAWPI